MTAADVPAAPGRPREFDESVVLDAALEVFWTDGYRSTTTRALEERLGLSQSSIYNAFGSKELLLEAALSRYEDRTGAELLDPLEASSVGLAAADRFFVDLGRWVTSQGRRGCLLINMMAEDGGRSAGLVARTRRYRRRVRDALQRALERAAAAGKPMLATLRCAPIS